MKSPTEFDGEGVLLCEAELPWELVPPYVGDSTIVEGAFFVKSPDGKRLFVLYSANGCWSDDYCLGVLEHTGGALCDAANWKKHDKPLFVHGNGVYGPGHATFFRSPDGSEVWCAYHGMKEHNETVTPAPRFFNIQPVHFDSTGYPEMDLPLGYEVDIVPPKGEID